MNIPHKTFANIVSRTGKQINRVLETTLKTNKIKKIIIDGKEALETNMYELPKGFGEVILLRNTLSWITVLNFHPLK